MLPLERYQIDRLLEEKAEQLEAIIGPFVQRCKNAGSYDDDDGRGMQINASDLYDGESLCADLFVNKRGRILVFRYSYEPCSSFDEDDGITEEESEVLKEQGRRWVQMHNPDQLHLALEPVQRAFRFLHPLEMEAVSVQDRHFWTYRFELLIRFLPESGRWDILWNGNPQTMREIRKLLPPLPCSQSGDMVGEAAALRLIKDLLEITERQDR